MMDTRHTKQFHTHEVKRVPVNLTSDARRLIAASGREGNKFPLALSEAFGATGQEVQIDLDAVRRSEYHVSDNDQQRLLHIKIRENDVVIYQTFIADHALWHEINGRKGFDAVLSAREIVRLYFHMKGK